MSKPLSQAEVDAARNDPKQANILYHDWEAATYDDKWSISYDERSIAYATGRFAKVAGQDPRLPGFTPYDQALEIGSGTGFFLLNLMQAGVARHGHVTDLSPGMVEVAVRNGTRLGLSVEGKVVDGESLPYDDNSMDLVVGHAILHHIPDVATSLREVLRVLRPGGRFVFAGEPTKHGDFLARRLSRATWWATTTVTKLPLLRGWRRPQVELDDSSRAAQLEAVVDLHTFAPDELRRLAIVAGATDVDVVTEEFTAAMLGWPVRTFEAAVPREKLGPQWAFAAMRAWSGLTVLDDRLLRHVVPEGLFYNALVTGLKP
ncbi:methyltransferase domain-containing protein [Epidermidibacterium keratini]|uniref:Methyltransferase domain-containing protein n=1 Tax=Epidermidibacterium keratini TaxID=1891644 RepID=A0A7L4YR80_9ACTN|nr:class I SAM-dependent methyltransferase [Epidermidibacterium keratini]QHC01755.1 methyltransferase domain-containing protein [Epidermidibacterium keratini]